MKECAFCQKPLQNIHSGFGLCKNCSLVYYLEARAVKYEDDYFNREYKEQYGRSYLDDEPAIRSRMAQRLKKAFRYVSFANKSTLLEIGSAAGYFLAEARQAGFEPRGWEISSAMASHANARGLPTVNLDFFSAYEQWKKQPGKKENWFDMVAAFYVLEHFSNQPDVWNALQELTAPGGLLLLATPSWRGPAFFFDRVNWFQNHPADHFIDYSDKGLQKIAKRYGFTALHQSSEGIHPGRFPGGNFSPLGAIYRKWQERVPFSDTIFTILQKKNS